MRKEKKIFEEYDIIGAELYGTSPDGTSTSITLGRFVRVEIEIGTVYGEIIKLEIEEDCDVPIVTLSTLYGNLRFRADHIHKIEGL